jgi:hypothetical protein
VNVIFFIMGTGGSIQLISFLCYPLSLISPFTPLSFTQRLTFPSFSFFQGARVWVKVADLWTPAVSQGSDGTVYTFQTDAGQVRTKNAENRVVCCCSGKEGVQENPLCEAEAVGALKGEGVFSSVCFFTPHPTAVSG